MFTLLLVFICDIGFTEFVDLMILSLFWLGVIETTRPELCPIFFQVDLAPTILRSMYRDGTPRPLSGSVSHHPTSPIPSSSTPIRARYPSTNSRDAPSPATQHAVTRPVPVHPNTAPSVDRLRPQIGEEVHSVRSRIAKVQFGVWYRPSDSPSPRRSFSIEYERDFLAKSAAYLCVVYEHKLIHIDVSATLLPPISY